jgi:ComF family protein
MPAAVGTCGACLRRPPSVTRTVVALDYLSPWDGLIAGFKFRQRPGLATLFAQQLQRAVAQQALPEHGLVVPVPLSQARLRERGYNQAWEIARRLARRLNLPADPYSLRRIVDTPHQVGLPREQRLANVSRAFAVDPLCLDRIAGRPVALVDDVMTTGATVEGAARALLQAGASSVQAWVVARAPGSRRA